MKKDIKEELLNLSKGHPLNSLFFHYQNIFGNVYERPQIKYDFLEFIAELIKDGELKLASNGYFLEGEPSEQIKIFKDSFPKNPNPNKESEDIGYFWWLISAPAGAVWIYPDGYEEWT